MLNDTSEETEISEYYDTSDTESICSWSSDDYEIESDDSDDDSDDDFGDSPSISRRNQYRYLFTRVLRQIRNCDCGDTYCFDCHPY